MDRKLSSTTTAAVNLTASVRSSCSVKASQPPEQENPEVFTISYEYLIRRTHGTVRSKLYMTAFLRQPISFEHSEYKLLRYGKGYRDPIAVYTLCTLMRSETEPGMKRDLAI